MTREEFFNELRRETGFMLPEDRREIYEHFRNCFSGRDEAEVIAELGSPKEAVKALLGEDNGTELTRPMKILTIIAAAAAAPIAVDAAVVIAAIVLVLCAVFALLLAVLPFAGIALWMGGIDSVIKAFFTSPSAADAVCRIGAGLMSGGVGVLILLLVYKVYRRFIPWLTFEIRSAYRKLRKWIHRMIGRIL